MKLLYLSTPQNYRNVMISSQHLAESLPSGSLSLLYHVHRVCKQAWSMRLDGIYN